jgi:hypothetical protein
MHLCFRAAVLPMLALLAACTSSRNSAPSLEVGALPVMERVMLGANRCWFKSGDPQFASYKMAPELNSYTGTPRILLVKKHSPEAKPLLVVQAQGTPAKLDAFGPLMNEPTLAARVHKDVNGWVRGSQGC